MHNLCTANHVIHDPLLTNLGHEQCAQLEKTFPRHAQVDLVTASPLRRTLYTALESFAPVFEAHPDMKLIALPDAQETSDVPCDTGSDAEVLEKEFAGKPVDLGLLHDGWNVKVRRNPNASIFGFLELEAKEIFFVSQEGRYAPRAKALKERARATRRWLKARPEKEIVLVTHGGYLHYFTEDWEDSSQYQGECTLTVLDVGSISVECRIDTARANNPFHPCSRHRLEEHRIPHLHFHG